MLTNKITTSNRNCYFGAKIVYTDDYRNYISYIYKYKKPKDNYKSTKINTELSEIIEYALTKHPSDAEIRPSIIYRKGELFNARGILASKYGILRDVEPARSDSGTAPIENIFRKILDKRNKKTLNFLLGEQFSKETDIWWEKWIKPIWPQINKTYREETISGSLHMDEKFNTAFNKQIKLCDNNKFIEYLKKLFK